MAHGHVRAALGWLVCLADDSTIAVSFVEELEVVGFGDRLDEVIFYVDSLCIFDHAFHYCGFVAAIVDGIHFSLRE